MTKTGRIRTASVIGAVAWMALIYRLSALPGSTVPGRFTTIGHFGLYAVLGGLYLLSLPQTSRPWHAAMIAVLLASLYGLTDEFHQSFVPGRMPDVTDWIVDTVGALAAVSIVQLARMRAALRA
ncbi:MAG: VanZ family protein [Coriobacteriia bacterium]|nr:VanZ family protein [Coriobacteriia bacterium]